MSASRWASLFGSLLSLCACGGAGDEMGSGPDAPQPDAMIDPVLTNECQAGTAQSQQLVAKATLLGQTRTHLYMHDASGVLEWPKSGGVPRTLAPLEPLLYKQHLVSEEGIFSVESDGKRAQLTTFDGQRASIAPPTGAVFHSASAAPGGAIYFIATGPGAVPYAIYRLRVAERSFEVVHRLDAVGFELSAQDDAVYWMRYRTTGDTSDFEVVEHRLGELGERVLAPLDAHRQFLQVFADGFYVRNDVAHELERRDRTTGERLATFPIPIYFYGALLQQGSRLLFSIPPGMQYSPACPPNAALYELEEGKAPRLVVSDAAPTAVIDGTILYYQRAYPTCCQSGSCSGGGRSVACHRL